MAQRSAQFGLKGGLNLSALTANGHSSDYRTGFHLGGLAHIHLKPKLGLQPELVYSSQGAAYDDGSETELEYVNIPLLVQYLFGRGWRLESGPQLGILTHAAYKKGNSETNVTNAYKKTEVSWAFGLGYLTASRLGIDVRYNLGLTDASKRGAAKNSVWQMGLFYQFLH